MCRLIDNSQIEEIDTYRLSGLRNRVEGKAEERLTAGVASQRSSRGYLKANLVGSSILTSLSKRESTIMAVHNQT